MASHPTCSRRCSLPAGEGRRVSMGHKTQRCRARAGLRTEHASRWDPRKQTMHPHTSTAPISKQTTRSDADEHSTRVVSIGMGSEDGLRSCRGSRKASRVIFSPSTKLRLLHHFQREFLAGTPRRFTCFRHRCFRGRLEGPPARAVKVCVRAAGRPNARVGQGSVCAGHVPRGRSRSDRVRPERGTDGTVALSVAFDSEERAQKRTFRAARDATELEI